MARVTVHLHSLCVLRTVNLPLIEEMLLERFDAKIATDNLEADDWLAIDSLS